MNKFFSITLLMTIFSIPPFSIQAEPSNAEKIERILQPLLKNMSANGWLPERIEKEYAGKGSLAAFFLIANYEYMNNTTDALAPMGTRSPFFAKQPSDQHLKIANAIREILNLSDESSAVSYQHKTITAAIKRCDTHITHERMKLAFGGRNQDAFYINLLTLLTTVASAKEIGVTITEDQKDYFVGLLNYLGDLTTKNFNGEKS